VAVVVTTAIIGANNNKHIFTCQYVVAAHRSVADWNRGTLCEKLLPFCADLTSNHEIIRRELTDWEQLSTASAFQTALEQCGSKNIHNQANG
jgi:hypothetical protein